MLRCVRCHASLPGWRERRETFACLSCGAAIRVDAIALDVVPERPAPRAFGERAMQSEWLAKLHDRWWRPLTFGVSTAFGAPSAREEARHALGLLAGRRGPWLDLSCGTGALTRPFVDAIGAGEVVGLDVSRAILAKARALVPGAVLVRADAARRALRRGLRCAISILA